MAPPDPDHGLTRAVAAITGCQVQRAMPLSGGSLSTVYRVTLADGQTVIAKRGDGVAREAHMLIRMASAGAPVPQVLGLQSAVLVMADLGAIRAPRSVAEWDALAETLRGLHAETGPRYGWPEDHAFDAVTIVNTPSENWPEFWAAHRLRGPAVGLPAALRHRIDRLCARIGDHVPRSPTPALLHGDLWIGNAAICAAGRPVLIDPACYFGDRHVDLAMLSLFADPPARFCAATGMDGSDWPALCAVYQLWPALVHLRLFGESYRGMVTARLDRLDA